jgi:hypothetical protein
MNKKKIALAVICAAALPLMAFADSTVSGNAGINNPTGINNITNISVLINSLLSTLWIIFAGIAVVCFVIAGILFLTAGGQAEKITAARSAFIWGIAGVVVGIIAYSIIAIVGSFLTGNT